MFNFYKIKTIQRGKAVPLVLVILAVLGLLIIASYFFIVWNRKLSEAARRVKEAKIEKEMLFEYQDEDKDGLNTISEMTAGTKVKEEDTDLDGIPDGWEVNHKLDPLDYLDALSDPDEDKLINLEEYQYGTDPQNSDTDNDGFQDGEEVEHGFNPKGSGRLKAEVL